MNNKDIAIKRIWRMKIIRNVFFCLLFLLSIIFILSFLGNNRDSSKISIIIFFLLLLVIVIYLSLVIKRLKKKNNLNNEAYNKIEPTGRAMPFLWFAFASSIAMTIWTCFWSFSLLFSLDSCTETGCGDAIAFSLIFDIIGSLILGSLTLALWLLGRERKAENARKKKIIVSITLSLAIFSIILLIATFVSMAIKYKW